MTFNRFALILALGLLGSRGASAALSIDGTANNDIFDSGSSVTSTLTTTKTNDIIVVLVFTSTSGTGANPLLSVTDTGAAGLTFAQRGGSSHDSYGSNCYALDVNPCSGNLDVYWAASTGILTGETIKATLTSALTFGTRSSMVVFGVNGATSLVTPWDPTGALPRHNTNTSASTVAPNNTWTTSKNPTLIIGFFGGAAEGAAGCTALTNWIGASSAVASNSIGANCAIAAALVEACLTSQTITAQPSTAATAWTTVADAIVGKIGRAHV